MEKIKKKRHLGGGGLLAHSRTFVMRHFLITRQRRREQSLFAEFLGIAVTKPFLKG